MTLDKLMNFMTVAEQLKCELRHSWTSSNRQESVAEHSWRLCVFAFLLKNEFSEYDMDKVIKMCLFHDIGEALSGDVPAFDKNEEDEAKEDASIQQVLSMLDDDLHIELKEIFEEIKELSTMEAKLFNALDKLEAVLQHNEAPIETWIPLEYDMNQTYGSEDVKGFPLLEQLRAILREDTIQKIEDKNKDLNIRQE